MEFVAGIDIGAKTVKVIIMDGKREVRGKSTVKTRPDFTPVAKEALDLALQQAGLKEKDLSYIATTGFGRYNVPFRDVQITEITCVARGAAFLFPKTHCVLDIGAQSTRAIRIHDGGKVREFRTNDKCAAGAGGFIERAAKYLEVKVENVGDLSIKSDKPETISSVCAVLAESEIINLVSAGATIGTARNRCAGFTINSCFLATTRRFRQYQNVALAMPRRRQNSTTVSDDWRCASMIWR